MKPTAGCATEFTLLMLISLHGAIQVLTNYAAQQRRMTLRYIMPGRARARCADRPWFRCPSQLYTGPEHLPSDFHSACTDSVNIQRPAPPSDKHPSRRHRWLRAGQTLFLRLRSEKRARQQIGINLDQERAEHARVRVYTS